MGYTLVAVIGPFLPPRLDDPLRSVNLGAGLQMVPLDEEAIDRLYAQAGPGELVAGFIYLTDSLAEHLRSRASEPLAYVEAEFFGGTGTQAAVVWSGHRTVLPPLATSNE